MLEQGVLNEAGNGGALSRDADTKFSTKFSTKWKTDEVSLWSKVREAWGCNPGSNAAGTDQACDHGRVPHEPGTAEFELFAVPSNYSRGPARAYVVDCN